MSFQSRLFLGLCLALLCTIEGRAQLAINEVQTANDNTIADAAGDYDDWIEIYNAGASVDLAGYFISDDPTDPLKFQIPAGTPAATTVPANGFLLLWADDDESQGNNHLSFKLSSGGETILLTDPNEVLVDSMVVSALAGNTSRGRSPDGGAIQQVFAVPTPDSSNGNGVPQASIPVINPVSSVRSGTFTVTINISAGTTIRYTTDGSDPVIDGQTYTGPFTMTDSSVVRAIGRRTGYADSPEDFASYLVNPPHDVAMVMITTDPDNLYDPQFGIYTEGENGISGPCELDPKNFNQDWQRPGNIVFFEPNGDVAFSELCEIEISGGCSRRDAKKSLNIGFDQTIDYQLYPSQTLTKWRGLKLRNGGNKRKTTRVADAFVQGLFEEELDLDQQASRPAVLYLNGEYWGYYTIRDRLNGDYLKTYYPDVGDVDLIKQPGSPPGIRHWIYEEVKKGTMDAYEEMTQVLETTDFTVPSNYEAIREHLDVESFIDYGLVQVFHRNSDWPGNNMRAWRERSPTGRIRYLLSDTGDYLETSEADDLELFTEVLITGGDPTDKRNPTDTLPYRALSENQDFRNEFTQRTCTYLATFWSSENVDAQMQQIVSEVADEMDRDAARWSGFQNTDTWEDTMDSEVTGFYNERPEYFRQSIETHFLDGVNDRYNLTVNFTPSEGHVVLHGNHFKIDPGHTGVYYKSVPIRTRAIAKPGYRFIEWSNVSDTTDRFDPALNRGFTANNKIIGAVFQAGALDVVVNEVHYNPEGTNGAEFVELYNPDSHAKYIGGHTFTNGLRFTFPSDAVIEPGEYLIVAREPALYQGNGYQVFGPFAGALDDSGETLALATPFDDSVFVTEYNDGSTWPEAADGWGASLELKTPLADPSLASNWQASYSLGGTPGAPNSSASGVVINEVLVRPAAGGDWVELHNPSAATVNISGWFISDDVFNPGRYQIPSGTTIPAGGFIQFNQSQLGFGFGDDDTDVVLARGANGIATGLEDVQDLSASMPGQSRGRHLRSDGVWAFPPMQSATPNAANSAPFAAPLRITELMVEPVLGKGEYIKFSNVSGLPIDLYDPVNGTSWALTGGIDFSFPLPTRIEACESVFITSEQPAAFKVQYSLPFSAKVFGPYTGKLNNGGESIKLRQPAPALADSSIPMALVEKVHYYDSAAWPVAPSGSVLVRQTGSGYSADPATWSVAAPGPADFPCEDLPPSLNAPAHVSIPEQALYQIQLSASDPEGDPFGFTLSANAPAGASISQSGLFSWTPSDAQGPGVYTFDVTVSEFSPTPRSDQSSWTITVVDVNDPPVFTASSHTETLTEHTVWTWQMPGVTDPEGGAITLQLSGAPAGMVLDPASGWLRWSPSESSGGNTYPFQLTATDPGGASAAMDITLSVLERQPAAILGTPCLNTNELVSSGSTWAWSQSVGANQVWAEPWFDDSSWANGAAPLGFNQGDEATVLQGGFVRGTFRHTFQVTDVENTVSLILEVKRDDAFVAYLNGQEITRDNLPGGTLTSSTLASSSVFGAAERVFNTFTIPASFLAEGDNTLAVAIHQIAANSNDMTFDLKLHATRNADCTPLSLDPERFRNAGVISWQAIPGVAYSVEVCDDLVVGIWAPLSTVTASASIEEVNDPTASAEMRRFYRIRRLP